MHPITFPNLGIELNINPVAFSIFGKDIFWYGIIITVGIILCLFLAKRDDGKHNIKWDDFLEYITYAIIVGIIFARIYYVVFKWDYYVSHLSEIFMIWNGGIAIYGGIIGALLTAVMFCKKKKISFLNLCDYCAPYLPLAQSIGRWGNFVNREAYGGVTDIFLKMGIFDNKVQSYIYVHPTFLYESICTFIIFLILYFKRRKKNENGELFYLYMFLYGVTRSIIEGFRTDSLYLYNCRISQVLAIVFALFFGILLLKQKIKEKNQK